MPSKSNINLRIHNAFTLGPQQPTIPCSHPDCPQHFFDRAGHSNHIRAAHPLDVPPPNAPNSPNAFVQPSPPQSGPSQSPPSSPTMFHFPSSLGSHAFKPVLNKDNPVWPKIRLSSPAYSSKSPSEDILLQLSEHLDCPLQETLLNSDVDFDFLPVDFTPFLDGIHQAPVLPSHAADDKLSSNSGTDVPPH